ncbi:unnamed protein product [Brassica rapa]|uniref:DC1 domain-containing protein n=1 Tax=Brassica campestris TaxID=3711 RepID=A0A3P5YJD9_BRACM|nr:unnamed protein product [Brassica rapa]VDC67802.1 unnamed protein product [Brassica rapa]
MLYYICHDCITTLHIGCMIGKYPYLKPSHRIKVDGLTKEITTTVVFLGRFVIHVTVSAKTNWFL